MAAAPTITAVPVGGLCNRLALLDSALALGRRLGRPVHLLWLLRPELGARFEDLFEPVPGLARVVDVSAHGRRGRLRLRLRKAWARLRGTKVWGHQETERWSADPEELLSRASAAGDLWIRGDDRVFSDGPAFRGFAPRASLAARVEAVRPLLTAAVGIHVRRTDNAGAIRAAPLESFLEAVRAERAADPASRFFLATDDPGVRTALRAELGEALFHHPEAAFDRNDPAAIAAAVVDLWSLAACRRLLGSPMSMFTLVAQQLGGAPCRIVCAPGA